MSSIFVKYNYPIHASSMVAHLVYFCWFFRISLFCRTTEFCELSKLFTAFFRKTRTHAHMCVTCILQSSFWATSRCLHNFLDTFRRFMLSVYLFLIQPYKWSSRVNTWTHFKPLGPFEYCEKCWSNSLHAGGTGVRRKTWHANIAQSTIIILHYVKKWLHLQY